ncbi:hypothetical protein [Entomohabitans teleogrylli]|uniref:hypothetical protein n=1 Tax=Entomohabitans teleogrylli TaxID=1384589 RepID=UPI000A582D02|nr:hypothetical protein [Entomohabitans teleogrylli]
MKCKELLLIIGVPGRYEVYSDGKGEFTALSLPDAAILITPEAHFQCIERLTPLPVPETDL